MSDPAVPDREPKPDVVLGHDAKGRPVVVREYWEVGEGDGIGRWFTKTGVANGDKWIPARRWPVRADRWCAYYWQPVKRSAAQCHEDAMHQAMARLKSMVADNGYEIVKHIQGDAARLGPAHWVYCLYAIADIGFVPLVPVHA